MTVHETPAPPSRGGESPAAVTPPAAAGHQTPSARLGSRALAGPARTWTVELPVMELLNANHRLHRQQAAKLTRAIREAAGWCTFAAKVPRLSRARIDVEVQCATERRRDDQNWQPSAKAATDGVVDAGVLSDDDSRHLEGPLVHLGDPDRTLPYAKSVTGKRVRLARLVLHITELPEVTR